MSSIDRTGWTVTGQVDNGGARGGPALTVQAAAAHFGVSEKTIRRRIKDGRLTADQHPTVQGYEWRIRLDNPDNADQGARQAPGQPPLDNGWTADQAAGEPIEAPFRVGGGSQATLVPLAPMLDQVRGLTDQLAALARRNEALALEAGQLRERSAQQAATITELRRRVEETEATRAAPPARPAPVGEAGPQARSDGPGATGQADYEETRPPKPTPTLWQRLRGLLGGAGE